MMTTNKKTPQTQKCIYKNLETIEYLKFGWRYLL